MRWKGQRSEVRGRRGSSKRGGCTDEEQGRERAGKEGEAALIRKGGGRGRLPEGGLGTDGASRGSEHLYYG